MANVKLFDQTGKEVSSVELNDAIFGIEPNESVVFDVIISQRASLRQGTHAVKNRSAVSGGGRKPWRQKGTGRARQGSIRAVQWVGGGRYGTPVPRDYSKKQNRKERRLAIKSALAEKAEEKAIIVLENLKLATPKTKDMKALLETLKIADNMILASRNLQNVVLISADEINVLDVVGTDVVVFTQDALNAVEEVLK